MALSVGAALLLSAPGLAQPTPEADEPAPGIAELIGLAAQGAESSVDLSAEKLNDTGFDPDAPNGPADADVSLGSDPYIDLVSDTAFSFVCDAVDEEGNPGACPEAVEDLAEEEEITPADVELLIQQAFQSLPVAPSPISYQPDGDWAAVNMDFIVYTDTAEQVLSTRILDVPVTFRLTPSHWTWDFGDGSPATPSSSPGAAYPNQTISHVYSSASDGVTVTLTTLWSGQFQIAGSGDWYPVDGFVTTTATAGPVEIVAFDVHLVPNQG